jgi:hypothetical protein
MSPDQRREYLTLANIRLSEAIAIFSSWNDLTDVSRGAVAALRDIQGFGRSPARAQAIAYVIAEQETGYAHDLAYSIVRMAEHIRTQGPIGQAQIEDLALLRKELIEPMALIARIPLGGEGPFSPTSPRSTSRRRILPGWTTAT